MEMFFYWVVILFLLLFWPTSRIPWRTLSDMAYWSELLHLGFCCQSRDEFPGRDALVILGAWLTHAIRMSVHLMSFVSWWKKEAKNSQKDLIVYAVNMIVQNIVPRVFVSRFIIFFLSALDIKTLSRRKKSNDFLKHIFTYRVNTSNK